MFFERPRVSVGVFFVWSTNSEGVAWQFRVWPTNSGVWPGVYGLRDRELAGVFARARPCERVLRSVLSAWLVPGSVGGVGVWASVQ